MPLLSLAPELLTQIIRVILLDAPLSLEPVAGTLHSLSLTCHVLRNLTLPHLYATASFLPPHFPLSSRAIDHLPNTHHLHIHLPPTYSPYWTTHTPALLSLIDQCTAVSLLMITTETKYSFCASSRSRNEAARASGYKQGVRSLVAVAVFPVLSYSGEAEVVVTEYPASEVVGALCAVHSRYQVAVPEQVRELESESYETVLVRRLCSMMAGVTWLDLTPHAIPPSGMIAWTALLRAGVGASLNRLRLNLPDGGDNGGMCKAVAELAGQLVVFEVKGGCVCEEMFPVGEGKWAALKYVVVECRRLCAGVDVQVFLERMESVVEGGCVQQSSIRVGVVEEVMWEPGEEVEGVQE